MERFLSRATFNFNGQPNRPLSYILSIQYLLLLLSCEPDHKDGDRDKKENREGIQRQGNRNQSLQTLTKECHIIIGILKGLMFNLQCQC